MPSSLALLRYRAYQRQNRRCYYCGFPMWEKDIDRFLSEYRVSPAQAQLFRCTAEHLKAKSVGGSNAASNIVAACDYCNRTRHRSSKPLEPDRYRQRVQTRLAKGRWLPLPCQLAPSA